jgi:hypothetical protein
VVVAHNGIDAYKNLIESIRRMLLMDDAEYGGIDLIRRTDRISVLTTYI